MTYNIEITEEANGDLQNIFEYIALTLMARTSASALLDRLEHCISELATMPERFHKYENKPWCSRGLRYVSVDNYCVFYIPNDETKAVTILRVLYGGRDIDIAILFFINH